MAEPDQHNHQSEGSDPAQPAAPPDQSQPPMPPEGLQGKQYSLSRLETELVATVHRNHQAIFAQLLSHIAQTRFGYPVTDRTLMQLSNDAKTLTLSERPIAPAQGQSPQPTDPGAVRAAE